MRARRERRRRALRIAMVMAAIAPFSNCVIRTKTLISTTTRTDETTTRYEYQAQEIKKATAQDPVVELKITRTPYHVAREIQTYQETKKDDPVGKTLVNFICGSIGGGLIGFALTEYDNGRQVSAMITGSILGGLSAAIIPLTGHPRARKAGTIEKISKTYPLRISDPMPLKSESLTVKGFRKSKEGVFKMVTDDQGILRLNLAQDLGMEKLKEDQTVLLIFRVMNAATQRADVFVVSAKIAAFNIKPQ